MINIIIAFFVCCTVFACCVLAAGCLIACCAKSVVEINIDKMFTDEDVAEALERLQTGRDKTKQAE